MLHYGKRQKILKVRKKERPFLRKWCMVYSCPKARFKYKRLNNSFKNVIQSICKTGANEETALAVEGIRMETKNKQGWADGSNQKKPHW